MPQRAAARAIARRPGRGQSREARKRGVVERGRVRGGERLERGRAREERVESGAGKLRTMRYIEQCEAPRARRETAPGSDGEGAEEEGEEGEMTLLQQLALRHKRDRELVDAIRRDLRL